MDRFWEGFMSEMPYSKPTLTQFGKVTALTHGGSGGGQDATQTKSSKP